MTDFHLVILFALSYVLIIPCEGSSLYSHLLQSLFLILHVHSGYKVSIYFVWCFCFLYINYFKDSRLYSVTQNVAQKMIFVAPIPLLQHYFNLPESIF
jgi:hypothetical protein